MKKITLGILFLFIFVFTTTSFAQVVQDGAFSPGSADDVTTVSFEHTTGTGSDRLTLVSVSWNAANVANTELGIVATFTPSGESPIALTPVITEQRTGGERFAAIYSLLNPASGQAGVVDIVFPASITGGIVAGAANFSGVHQTTPLGAALGANDGGTTSSELSVTLSSLTGTELVFDVAWTGGNPAPALNLGASQSVVYNTAGIGNSTGGSSTEQATGSSVTMSWDRADASAGQWVIAAVAINPAGAGDITPPVITLVGDNPQIINLNDPYVELGATASDDTDGDITGSIDIDASAVNVTIPGDYDVTYNVSDLAGNPAVEVVRTVSVVDGNNTDLAVDGISSTGFSDDVNSLSFSHTTGTGSDRLLLVGVSWNSGANDINVTSVTFNGAPLSLVTEAEIVAGQAQAGSRNANIYSLLNPPAGTTANVTVNFSGVVPNGIVAGATNFKNVDQLNPLGTPVTATNAAGAAPTVLLTGLGGSELVFDTVFQGGADNTQTLTAGANQNVQWHEFAGNTRGASSLEQAIGSDVTMSWTANGNGVWAIAAVPINPIAIDPTIYVTGTPLSDFSAEVGFASDEQSYVVSGVNLTGDINITPPAGFEISLTTGSGFVGNPSSLTLSPDLNGNVSATEIFIIFNPSVEGAVSGNISHTSAGAATQNVAVSGDTEITTGTDGSSNGTGDDVNTLSFNHTIGTGPDRLLLVGVSWNSGANDINIISVTFNGASLSLVTEAEIVGGQAQAGSRNANIYSLVNPPAGTTANVTVNFSGIVPNGIVAGATNFQNVDQVNPLGTPGTATNAAGAAPTVTLTGLGGSELVFDTVFQGGANNAQVLTEGAGQTVQWHEFAGNTRGAASVEQATGSSVTMSWTATGNGVWAIAAVPVNPTGSVGGSTLDLDVTLQGRSSGNYGGDYSVILYSTSDLLNPAYSLTRTADALGNISVIGIVDDEYVVLVKHPKYLQRAITVNVSGTANAVVPELLGGDANNDNVADIIDFSIISASYNQALGDGSYNANADINGDDVVDIADFSILSSNYNTEGEDQNI